MSHDLDLSRRAVAAGWRWQRGCQSADGLTVYEMCADGTPIRWGDSSRYIQGRDPEWCSQRWSTKLPDFNDAPTRGALLEQVRTDWDDIGLHAVGLYRDGAWHWRVRGGKHHGGTFNRATEKWHDSETAALVAALEAAPKEKGL